jgi:hypothetical protein
MTDQLQCQSYPGEGASSEELFLLAEEYRRAAHTLLGISRRRKPLSRAPFHLNAIHAIELYLNALLLLKGVKAQQLRALNHDLSARIHHELAAGLTLRVRTAAHLADITKRREYLVSRYGTNQMKSVSEITRLKATLEEIRESVAQRLGAERISKVQPAAPEIHQV